MNFVPFPDKNKISLNLFSRVTFFNTMKKHLIILLCFLSVGFLHSQTIVHTYSFTDPVIEIFGQHQVISFSNTQLHGNPGEPLLPYKAVSLLLPPGHEATRVSVEFFDEIPLEGSFRLAPAQFSRPLSIPGISLFEKNESVYQSAEPYPVKANGNLSTHYMNGFGFAQTVITPLKYTPATGEISYYRRAVVRIETRETARGRNALNNLSASPSVKNTVLKHAQNPDVAAGYSTRSKSTTDYQILVITPASYTTALEPLTQLYLPRGMKTQIATIESIQSGTMGTDLPEKIRNYIIQEYQQHGIEHVVLAGDVEHVPHRGFYCHVQSSSAYEDDNIPADLYYAALDGNWNTNGNSRWGEIGEDDLLPELSVGRMSFSNTTELAAMLNKTIMYQNQPVQGELRNPLLAGENLYYNPDTWGSDYLNLLVGTHNENGYTTTGIPETHNIQTLYDEDAVWDKNTLINAINSGRNFVHHSGHANDSYVMKLNSWDITNANFSGVNGILHNFPVVYTHGCICGAFDVNDCIAEKMTGIENFAAAFVGNSRYGWFNEGQTEGPSAHLHREFTDALFSDSLHRIGRAHTESKIATAPWVNAPGQWEEGALRWCFYDCNVLGDPVMGIWTDEVLPVATQYPASIITGTPQFDITVTSGGQPVKGLTAAFLVNGMLIGKGTTGTDGNATVVIDPPVTSPGEAQLVVSGYNCLPVYYPVTIAPGNAPYVIYASHSINDSQGNNNGMADYGETLGLNVTLQNVGQANAQNVTALLSSYDPYITISDNSEDYGDIPAGGQAGSENAFTVTLSENVPDNYEIEFTLTVQSGETWLSTFRITAHAPVIEAGNATVSDGNNGNPDPGETFHLEIPVSNTGHSQSQAVSASLTCNSNYIDIPQGNAGPIVIEALSDLNIVFENITASTSTPVGTPVTFLLTLTKNTPPEIILQREYSYTVGQVIEDFESGNFLMHPWQHGGSSNWTITQSSAYQETFSARSGQISHNQYTDLTVRYEVLAEGEISFYFRVSTEEGYDYLRFYLDDVKMGEWSGEQDWTRVSFPVTPGSKAFRWSYIKDAYVSSGADAAWLDYIIFPPVDTSVGIDEQLHTNAGMSVFPNPATGSAFLNTGNAFPGFATLTLTDLAGREVRHLTDLRPASDYKLDLSGLKAGVYLVRLQNNQSLQVKKLIVK